MTGIEKFYLYSISYRDRTMIADRYKLIHCPDDIEVII